MPFSPPGRLGRAAIVSTLLVLPFVILEWLNREDLTRGFPAVLFAVLWLLPFAFVLLVLGLLRTGARTGTSTPVRRLLTAACLAVIAWIWAAIVIDQMPCFLGVPNCD